MLAQKRVDGLLVMCAEYPDELLNAGRIPVNPMVVMDWGEARKTSPTASSIMVRRRYMAGRYLIERGHRDIGVIPGQLARNTAVAASRVCESADRSQYSFA